MDEFIFQMEVISIHAPPRGATFSICPSIHVSVFQFTPLREGRRNRCRTLFRVSEFQFTPLREGRHSRRVLTDRRRISIHAPPRGATGSSCTGRKLSGAISIHAPPRGATSDKPVTHASSAFQFTPLREGRRQPLFPLPARCQFQFTPLREGRLPVPIRAAGYLLFQFTPLREGRRQAGNAFCFHRHFNSRPSARGDSHKQR